MSCDLQSLRPKSSSYDIHLKVRTGQRLSLKTTHWAHQCFRLSSLDTVVKEHA